MQVWCFCTADKIQYLMMVNLHLLLGCMLFLWRVPWLGMTESRHLWHLWHLWMHLYVRLLQPPMKTQPDLNSHIAFGPAPVTFVLCHHWAADQQFLFVLHSRTISSISDYCTLYVQQFLRPCPFLKGATTTLSCLVWNSLGSWKETWQQTISHLFIWYCPKPSPSDVSFLPVQSTRDGTYRNGARLSWCAALILFAHRNLQSTSSRPVTGLVRYLTCDTYGIVVMFSCLVVHFRKNFPAICWYMGRQEPRGFRFFWCVYQCLSTSP